MLSKASVKYIQSLQHKKFRDEHHVFVAEGPKLLTELIEEGFFELESLFLLKSWLDELDEKLLKKYKDKIQVVEEFELEKISALKSPNKGVGVFKKREPVSDFKIKGSITLVLDDINDPGNMGTIIRTADWFGIKNIVCSLNTVDCYNNKVVQSTMSSLARVNIFYTDLVKWLEENKNVPIYCTALNGLKPNQIKIKNEAILIIGNEANGVSSEVMNCADEMITIPKIGKAESLNAAVATSILLYEFKR
jgi:TrmH family RNA methyltransferase